MSTIIFLRIYNGHKIVQSLAVSSAYTVEDRISHYVTTAL